MTKIYAIGDIHGCLDELKFLMEKIDRVIKEEDILVFLGDYIDRGPNSKGVIDFLIEHKKNSAVHHVFLRGNHEDMMMQNEVRVWCMNGGHETLESYGFTSTDAGLAYPNKLWETQFPKEHVDFYNQTRLYYTHQNMTFVHAGLHPNLDPENTDPQSLMWDRTYVNYKGSYFQDKTVVFGHTPAYEIIENPNSYGLDTACVFGGKLTCGIFDPITGKLLDTIQRQSNYSWS